ncbi:hypothetical protein LCGC14_0574010 [marine sediment metagenome]|uniref:Uncharacterized protein n=1 Tax=marine sediment metagenome TaxID=412755 RepID=A0A0F9U4N7_9ZZZZ
MTLKELQELKKELTRHDYRYYILFRPTITDLNYDMLYEEYEAGLKELVGGDTISQEMESGYPEWVKREFKDCKPLT